MFGMRSDVRKALHVDTTQCGLRTDKGCYRQEIGQVDEEGPVFVLNTMGDEHSFCLPTYLNRQSPDLERNVTHVLQTCK
jgi:hypothetical protein